MCFSVKKQKLRKLRKKSNENYCNYVKEATAFDKIRQNPPQQRDKLWLKTGWGRSVRKVDKHFIEVVRVKEMNIRYFLLKEYVKGQGETYGISVESGEEQVTVRQITTKREDIEELLERLIRGGVTPIAVRDVMEDWLLR